MGENRLSNQLVKFVLTRKDEELARLDEKKVAEIFCVELSKLKQAFKNDMNLSINKFIKREKVYRAVFAIEQNRVISTQSLSKKLGFPRLSHFSREFKKMMLIDPDRYIHLKKFPPNLFGLRSQSGLPALSLDS